MKLLKLTVSKSFIVVDPGLLEKKAYSTEWLEMIAGTAKVEINELYLPSGLGVSVKYEPFELNNGETK